MAIEAYQSEPRRKSSVGAWALGTLAAAGLLTAAYQVGQRQGPTNSESVGARVAAGDEEQATPQQKAAAAEGQAQAKRMFTPGWTGGDEQRYEHQHPDLYPGQ